VFGRNDPQSALIMGFSLCVGIIFVDR
jgi:hypothetical protein